jgi:hypothetical protein
MKPISKVHRKDIDDKYKCDEWGKWSRWFNTKESVEALGLKYIQGRGIKVFVAKDFDIREYLIIKTIYSHYGLAPKIFSFGQIKEGNWYVEMEDANCLSSSGIDIAVLDWVIKEIDWITPYEIDLKLDKNYLNGYYLDFHKFKINWKKFEVWIREEMRKSHWGKKNEEGKPYAYQSSVLSVGKRDTSKRIDELKLWSINFEGKTVLDIGCNLGEISHFAALKKASRVVGVDCFCDFKLSADILKYYCLIDNLEFIEEKLTPDNIDKFGKFDIVFYLAMIHSLGIPSKLKDIVNDTLVFEGHNLMDKDDTATKLKKLFNKVEYIGNSTDRGIRPIFICQHPAV